MYVYVHLYLAVSIYVSFGVSGFNEACYLLFSTTWSNCFRPSCHLRKILFMTQMWCPASCCQDRSPTMNYPVKPEMAPLISSCMLPSTSSSPLQDQQPSSHSADSPHPPPHRPLSRPANCLLEHSLPDQKFAFISHSLLQGQLDILVVTKCWHQGPDDVLILQATASGYSLHDHTRPFWPLWSSNSWWWYHHLLSIFSSSYTSLSRHDNN